MADYPGLPHTRFSSGNIAQTLTSSSQSRTTPRNAVFVARIATYLFLCDTNSPQNSTMNLSWSDHKTVKILSASRLCTSSHYQKGYLDLRFWCSVFVKSNNISTNIETAMLSVVMLPEEIVQVFWWKGRRHFVLYSNQSPPFRGSLSRLVNTNNHFDVQPAFHKSTECGYHKNRSFIASF